MFNAPPTALNRSSVSARGFNYSACTWSKSAMLMFFFYFFGFLIKTHLRICGLSLQVTCKCVRICKGERFRRALPHLCSTLPENKN